MLQDKLVVVVLWVTLMPRLLRVRREEKEGE
jgi:hypothetical protein